MIQVIPFTSCPLCDHMMCQKKILSIWYLVLRWRSDIQMNLMIEETKWF